MQCEVRPDVAIRLAWPSGDVVPCSVAVLGAGFPPAVLAVVGQKKSPWPRPADESVARPSDEYIRSEKEILTSGNTAAHGPGLSTRKDDKHQESYGACSGDALGEHSGYGGKSLGELVASWSLLFGHEAALVCVLAFGCAAHPS